MHGIELVKAKEPRGCNVCSQKTWDGKEVYELKFGMKSSLTVVALCEDCLPKLAKEIREHEHSGL